MAFIPLTKIKEILKQTGKYWIVFTGDSLTSCEWVHPNWRDIVLYVLQNELEDSWGLRSFNFAYDGATTKDILDKINDIVLIKPQLVIGLMGGNDPTFKVSASDSVKNIQEIANHVISSGAEVVWASSTPAGEGSSKNAQYEPYSKAFLEIPIRNNFYKVDMYNLYQKYPTSKLFTFISEAIPVEGIKAGDSDLQHPNQLGNAYIAKIILEEVFGVAFDPEKYIETTLKGEKYPRY